ncbi:hypothetical protein [uncultured Polaribacter sp.]|uniref:hypothetical protein n=1 Tax=uncultured Polaribacter sp. TaxID=174711 RepID=UPI00262DA27D|nr:hypothetical protein [uncultured Polaribacter sp.]
MIRNSLKDYLDFLNVIFNVEYTTYFILNIILLITLVDVIFFRKKIFLNGFLKHLFYNSILFFFIFFILYYNDPVENLTSSTLNRKIRQFSNRFRVSNFLFFINTLLLIILFFKKKPSGFDIEKHSFKVIGWCVDNYPKSGLKKHPTLFFNNQPSKFKGEYEHQSKKITIFTKNILSIKDLTNTLIHEYFHFYLDHGKSKQVYYEKLATVGYEDHPEELICNISAKKLTEIYFKQYT